MSKEIEHTDDLTEYRITQLETAVGTLSGAVEDIKSFMLSIRIWIKALALVWTFAQAAIIALLYVLIQHIVT